MRLPEKTFELNCCAQRYLQHANGGFCGLDRLNVRRGLWALMLRLSWEDASPSFSSR
jgi:hypothetical protein